jgi:16S rRNA (guanine(1405)-N(7))-methyltransferase
MRGEDQSTHETTTDAVVAAVLRSRRYRTVSEPTVERLAQAALVSSGGDVKEAVKRTKRRLHESFGAFLATPPPYDRLAAALDEAAASGDDAAVRQALLRAMQFHASTQERLPVVDRFFAAIFAVTGQPADLLDVACGLNPLAVPWMNLGRDAVYRATDIDHALVGFVDHCVGVLGVPHVVAVEEALATPPDAREPADVALLLKADPCLESQQKGSGYELVDGLRARVLVVSFPRRSLGGREKGMTQTYAQTFEQRAREHAWSYETLQFPSELVYVVWR